ncbi:MAG: prepilin-type N-terminal cleavage/methylation domain-containing protein [Candidatus Omnitrophica bacterium]|nr:prepilin-type N-terminal cleavage/methylation domain-containing protein [Candidatus Omnitrophota bacterium]MBU1853258.1 prepilin-type N-terminal cleavage/methylation domain-containing protein [Candidatus Omnitrophota bacterium]
MLKFRKGFTILELLIVVLIIGILAAVGIPQLAESLEKSKTADAKSGLYQIYRAEEEYAANRYGVYTNSVDDLFDVALTERYWIFTIDTPTSVSFTAIATRTGGAYSGQTISIDNNANISGNWEFL